MNFHLIFPLLYAPLVWMRTFFVYFTQINIDQFKRKWILEIYDPSHKRSLFKMDKFRKVTTFILVKQSKKFLDPNILRGIFVVKLKLLKKKLLKKMKMSFRWFWRTNPKKNVQFTLYQICGLKIQFFSEFPIRTFSELNFNVFGFFFALPLREIEFYSRRIKSKESE